MKKPISDKQFKNQVIFTIKGIQANLRRIHKMFPEAGLNGVGVIMDLQYTISMIKIYKGQIVRKPK